MPFYEFICRDCGCKWEDLRAMSARGREPGPCPKCKSVRTEKVMSAAQFSMQRYNQDRINQDFRDDSGERSGWN